MNRSEHIGGLAKALATAQGQIEDAVKSKTNPHFRSAYADLAAVRAAIQKPLSENGLAYTQLLSTSADGLTIETMLIHGDSGEFISEALTLPLAQPSSQAIGSAASYGRRYSLMAILGIAADDDDGNAAQAAAPASPALGKAKWGASSQAKKRGDWEAFQDDLRDVHSVVMLDKLQKEYRTNFYPKWSQAWRDQAEQIFDRHRQDFTTDAEPPMPLKEALQKSVEIAEAEALPTHPYSAEEEAEMVSALGPPRPAQTRADYIRWCHDEISAFDVVTEMRPWWDKEADARRRFRLTQAETDDLKRRLTEKRAELLKRDAEAEAFEPLAR